MTAQTTIFLSVDSSTRTISPLLFGGFIEHMGECIHNGLWMYESCELPLTDHQNLNRVRRDVLFALARISPSVIRWPGGCYADVYHWQDAIGPRNQRTTVINRFWKPWAERMINSLGKFSGVLSEFEGSGDYADRIGPDIRNQFGTIEFLTLCEQIHALPYITVNYGSGSPEEAANWVEYCNGNETTDFGRLRALQGRYHPFNVPIWGIGNEIYLENEQGYEKDPSHYGRRYMEFARRMKENDPGIRLVGCGWNQNNWNEGFLGEVDAEFIDYLSIHQYLPLPSDLVQLVEPHHPHRENAYYAMMAAPFALKKQILKAWNSLVRRFGQQPSARVAVDEWGVWYTIHDLIKTNYNLQDGLFAALVLMLFQRFSDICSLGLWSTLINALGMIRTDDEGLVLTPVYHVFKLFREHTYSNLIDNLTVETDHFETEAFGQIGKISGNPMVEASATISDDGSKVSLMIVNKHFTDAITARLNSEGLAFFRAGRILELTADSPFDYNTEENRDAVQVTEKSVDDISPEMNLLLKPHSITLLKMTKLDLGLGI